MRVPAISGSAGRTGGRIHTGGPQSPVQWQRCSMDRPARGQKEQHMAKGLTKTALIRTLAEATELPTKKVGEIFEVMAATAMKETKKNGEFTIPGIGKLVKAERKARVGRNPQTGEAIKIKAKTVVKFRIAKAAKDAIAPVKK